MSIDLLGDGYQVRWVAERCRGELRNAPRRFRTESTGPRMLLALMLHTYLLQLFTGYILRTP